MKMINQSQQMSVCFVMKAWFNFLRLQTFLIACFAFHPRITKMISCQIFNTRHLVVGNDWLTPCQNFWLNSEMNHSKIVSQNLCSNHRIKRCLDKNRTHTHKYSRSKLVRISIMTQAIRQTKRYIRISVSFTSKCHDLNIENFHYTRNDSLIENKFVISYDWMC